MVEIQTITIFILLGSIALQVIDIVYHARIMLLKRLIYVLLSLSLNIVALAFTIDDKNSLVIAGFQLIAFAFTYLSYRVAVNNK